MLKYFLVSNSAQSQGVKMQKFSWGSMPPDPHYESPHTQGGGDATLSGESCKLVKWLCSLSRVLEQSIC